MIRQTLTRTGLPALCAAALILLPAIAGAQQVLVPAQQARPVPVTRPAVPVQPVVPDWYQTNRTLQVIRAQEAPRPSARGQAGLDGGEAARIYQNYLQGIGSAPRSGSGGAGYGSPTGFGEPTGFGSGMGTGQ